MKVGGFRESVGGPLISVKAFVKALMMASMPCSSSSPALMLNSRERIFVNCRVTINRSVVVISEEIGGTVEQHYNSPGLGSGVALLNNTTAGHGVRNVHSINVIEIEPILLWGSVFISLLRVGRSVDSGEIKFQYSQ